MPRNSKEGATPDGPVQRASAPPRARRTKTATEKTTTGKTANGKAAATGGRRTTAERTMTDQHRQALQSGRAETRVVRSYLEALERQKPRRGPRKTVEKLRNRLEQVRAEMEQAEVFDRLALHQEILDLEQEIEQLEQESELPELQRAFTEVAASYSARRGISLQAWLAVGVPRQVLRDAGVRD